MQGPKSCERKKAGENNRINDRKGETGVCEGKRNEKKMSSYERKKERKQPRTTGETTEKGRQKCVKGREMRQNINQKANAMTPKRGKVQEKRTEYRKVE